MSEEIQDEKPTPEVAPESSAEETPSESENTDKAGIPHSRVKEMVENAKSKGREEALAELLKENSEPKEPEEEVKSSTEQEEALKLLKQAVRSEIGPYLVKQEVEKFLDKHPDALDYVDDIKKMRTENPKLSWDQAYKLASYEDKIKSSEESGFKTAEKAKAEARAASTEKPSASGNIKPKSLIDKLKDPNVKASDIEGEVFETLQKQLGK